jgi:hypothetical protein
MGSVAQRSAFPKTLRRKAALNPQGVNAWKIIADDLSKAGWSLGWVSALDLEGRTIWIVDAHRDDGKLFVACAGETVRALAVCQA